MPSSDLVRSLTRGLVILEQIAQSENGLSLTQVCDILHLKSPTAHNLLRTLMARGYIEKRSRPTRYVLGTTMVDLVDQYRNRSMQRQAAKVVGEIFAKFGNIRVTYAEEIVGDVVLRLRMTPERPGLLEQPWNSVMLPHTSATVLIFQAFWSPDKLAAYRQKYPFEDYGAYVWQTQEKLEAFLEQVRRDGYAAPPVDRSRLYRVAVPIFSSTHEFIGALGSAISVNEIDDFEPLKQKLVQHLKAGAEELSNRGGADTFDVEPIEA